MSRASASPQRQRGFSRSRLARFTLFLLGTFNVLGCDRLLPPNLSSLTAPARALTPTAVRADRRLYAGAPPVIPHQPLNITCTECHTGAGKEAPPLGFAPANPHAATAGIGGTSYCQQCHVFRRAEQTFLDGASDFVPLPQQIAKADRLYPGAPPVIPHRVFMRENCTSCHSGPSARPEIVCKHTNRANCRQCHVSIAASSDHANLATAPAQ